jgi:hypothetical protein
MGGAPSFRDMNMSLPFLQAAVANRIGGFPVKHLHLKLLLLLATASVVNVATAAAADFGCQRLRNSYDVDLGEVSVVDNVAKGSALTDWQLFPAEAIPGTPPRPTPGWACEVGGLYNPYIKGFYGAVDNYEEGGQLYSVYPTGAFGIGIVLAADFSVFETPRASVHNEITRFLGSKPVIYPANYSYYLFYKLIKTENGIDSGFIRERHLADTWLVSPGNEQFPIVLKSGFISVFARPGN